MSKLEVLRHPNLVIRQLALILTHLQRLGKINSPFLHEVKFKLNIREAHNGDLMIFDHPDIDIVLMVEKKKVVTFAKDLATDVVYGISSRLMEVLRKKGVIAYETIQEGMSMAHSKANCSR